MVTVMNRLLPSLPGIHHVACFRAIPRTLGCHGQLALPRAPPRPWTRGCGTWQALSTGLIRASGDVWGAPWEGTSVLGAHGGVAYSALLHA